MRNTKKNNLCDVIEEDIVEISLIKKMPPSNQINLSDPSLERILYATKTDNSKKKKNISFNL